MQDSQKRLRPVVKDPYLLPLETEPTNIIDAMNTIVSHSENTGFTDNLLFYLQKPIQYLCKRLKINENQAVLLSVVCEFGIEEAVTTNRLSNYFGCSNLNAVAFIKELDDLVAKRLLTKEKTFDTQAKAYTVQWDMLTAYSNNEVYEPQVYYNTCEELLYAIESISNESDSRFSYRELHNQIQLLLNDNTHLAFTKTLLGQKFIRNDQALLINACLLLCCHNQCSFDYNDCSRFVDRRYLSTCWPEFLNGGHLLIKEGWIEPCCDDGLEDMETFQLTEKAKNELLSEVKLKPSGSHIKYTKDLIQPQDIIAKSLHYNNKESEQVRRLSDLLEQQHFTEIHERLTENGMRTGFACLFYGAPGTGKTETVMQLARATGRGVYQVNMANIRSKWVGESEKNVKAIFNQYHYMVNHSEVAPILLLNEADALLGNRFTNVNRSVEKMENTMQNIILEAMEKLDGILIATTNLTENLDPAFERRFLFKIKFDKPEANARMHIWEDMIPEIKDIENHDRIVGSYAFSGGQIENIARKCKIESILNGKAPDFDMLKTFCDEENLVKERSRVAGFRNAS